MRKALCVLLALLLLLLAGCAAATADPEPEAPPAETEAAEPAGEPEPEPEPEPIPEPDPLPLAGHIICLDPGHAVTPGVRSGEQEPYSPLSDATKPRYVSGTEGKGMTEEKLNLIVGLKLRDALRALGAEVVMTREVSEITISNIERCKLANESGADVHVHIHADGSTSPGAHGVSVLVPAGDLLGTPSIKGESVRLGKLMADMVAEETGAKNLGTVDRSDLTGLNFSEIPSVFIEMGFMTNPEEDAKLESDAYQNKIVRGMARSLAAWYGVELDALSETRLDALAEKSACSVAYAGFAVDTLSEDFRASAVREAFPCAKSAVYVDAGGDDVFVLVPTDPASTVTVERVEPDGNGTLVSTGETLYTGDGAPVILRCNVSDIMPNTLVTVTGRAGGTFSASPSLSLRDGGVSMDGAHDFTEYPEGMERES